MVPLPSIVIHLLAFFSARLHSDLGLDLRVILSQELLTAQGGSSNHNAKCVLRVGMGEEARGKSSRRFERRNIWEYKNIQGRRS